MGASWLGSQAGSNQEDFFQLDATRDRPSYIQESSQLASWLELGKFFPGRLNSSSKFRLVPTTTVGVGVYVTMVDGKLFIKRIKRGPFILL